MSKASNKNQTQSQISLRKDFFQSILGVHLSSPHNCYEWASYFSREVDLDEEDCDIDSEKVSKVFAVFSITQDICHKFLKDAYENEKFNTDVLKEIEIEKILSDDQKESQYFANISQDSTVVYGINYFFTTLVKALKKKDCNDDTKKEKIKSLFEKLLNNTINFFHFVDTNIGSICQYLKDVDERFCKDDNLIKMKRLFTSFNNLREPAQQLIHLYNSMMIKEKIINEKEGIENENKAKNGLKPVSSFLYQQKSLQKLLVYIENEGKNVEEEEEEEEAEEDEAEEEEAEDE